MQTLDTGGVSLTLKQIESLFKLFLWSLVGHSSVHLYYMDFLMLLGFWILDVI